MKTVKVIIGLVVGFFATTTMFQMFFEESGAGLYGAVTGYVIIMTICIWLVYSGSKNKEVMVQETVNKQESDNIYKQITNLKHLRDEGILTEEEYSQKQETISKSNLDNELKNSDDYKKLKELYESGILTKEEFNEKTETLRLKLANLRQKQKEEEKLGFTVTEEISEGYYVMRDNDFNYGFADEGMNKIIDTIYELAESFKEGLALVRYNGKFGFINKNNETVIPFIYDSADSFKDGIAKVRKGKEEFYINNKGERQ